MFFSRQETWPPTITKDMRSNFQSFRKGGVVDTYVLTQSEIFDTGRLRESESMPSHSAWFRVSWSATSVFFQSRSREGRIWGRRNGCWICVWEFLLLWLGGGSTRGGRFEWGLWFGGLQDVAVGVTGVVLLVVSVVYHLGLRLLFYQCLLLWWRDVVLSLEFLGPPIFEDFLDRRGLYQILELRQTRRPPYIGSGKK